MKVSCLLLGARRRVYFVKKIREELVQRGKDYRIIFTDTDDLDPVRFFCDSFYLIPSCEDPKWEQELVNIIEKEKVNLIIPWNDKDILKLNSIRATLKTRGVDVALPSPEVVELFNDKLQTAKWLEKEGLPFPETFFLKEHEILELSPISFPIIVKPRFGQGSLNVELIQNSNDFKSWIAKRKGDYLLQEYIEGTEYTVDVFQSNHEIIFSAPRRRLKVRGGECLISKIEIDKRVTDLAEIISAKLKIDGIYNFQVICNDESLKIIEFNPRFGGGSDLTIQAGGNIPKLILELFVDKKTKFEKRHIEPLTMTRYFSAEFFK